MKYRNSFLILLVLWCSVLSGQQPDDLVRAMKSHDDFSHAHLALSVMPLDGNENSVKLNDEKKYIPASVLKLVTNLSGVKILGPDFRFSTQIMHSGTLKYDGTLEGDIIVIGGGDPTLGAIRFRGVRSTEELLNYISQQIRVYGIRCIEGRILIDDSYFAGQGARDGWQFNDLANYYAAGAWSLNINENQYSINFDTRGKTGSKAKMLGLDPPVGGLTFTNKVTVGKPGSGDNAYIYGDQFGHHKEIRGTLGRQKKAFTIKGALPDPPMAFADMLQTKLNDSGISCNGIGRIQQPGPLHKILSIESPPLERIVYQSNIESNNLYAEAICKALGRNRAPESGDKDEPAEIIHLLTSYKLNTREINMEDGAGLTKNNLISPGLMAGFIKAVALDLNIDYVKKLLAQPGERGTARYIMHDGDARSEIWLKTGSMTGVQCYAGILRSKTGKHFSFCLMANAFDVPNSRIRDHFDRFLEALYLQL